MTTDNQIVTPVVTPPVVADVPPQAAPAMPTPTPAPASPTPVADAPAATDWPSDWRTKAAGGDEKLLKALERYNSPVDGFKALQELRTKMSSGEYKKAVPAPEDPVALAEWRKENGVPESADKYDMTMPDGLVIGAEDKPFVDEFVKAMHDKNMPAGPVKEAVAAYFAMQQKQIAAAVNEDRVFQQQAEESLRQEWGHEYLPNYNLAKEFAVSRFGEDVGNAILQAGPDAVKAVAAISREINPAMTLVPNSNNPTQAISDELATLKGKIGTPEWFRNPAMQTRYQQLLVGQEAMSKRG